MEQFFVLPTNAEFLRSQQSWTRETLLGVLADYQNKQKTRLHLVREWLANQLVISVLVQSRQQIGFLLRKYLKPLKFILLALGLLSLVFTLVVFAPRVYYMIVPAKAVVLTPKQASSVLGGDFKAGTRSQIVKTEKNYQPDYDPTLPKGDWLIIEQIGIRTQLNITTDVTSALTKGVWLDPEYGRPGDQDKPIILAAHRFGYKWWWQNDYWKKNSFYKLPQTKAGTVIKLISNQRQWQYEIYKAEEGEELIDYDADLILYTCKFLNAPIRYIRYARLINPTRDSQST